MAKNIGQAALAVMKRDLGLKENPPGSNRGPRPYMDGEPWCAEFVTWALREVGWEPGAWDHDFCPSWVQAAEAGLAGMRVLRPDEFPQPGDLALYDWGRDRVADHIGVVDDVISLNAFTAVEGNTSVGNDSNGGEVMLRTRDRSSCRAIIRLPGVQVPLKARLRAAGYGARTVTAIMRRLAAGYQGTVPNPRDREMFDNLRRQGLGPDSARKVVKATRRK